MIFSSHFSIYVNLGLFKIHLYFYLIHVICMRALILDWTSNIVSFTLMGGGYFCIPINAKIPIIIFEPWLFT